MNDAAHVRDDKRWPRGQDGALTFVILGEAEFTLTAAALDGAVSLGTKPLKYAVGDNAVFYCQELGIAVVCNGAPSFGAESIAIDAANSSLPKGARFRIVLDPTTWTMRWRLQTPETDTVLITKTTSSGISVVASDDTLYKLVSVALDADDTDDAQEPLELGSYHHDLWRTDSGFAVALASGDFQLAET